MDRKILHIDMNSFYASVELLTRPELREMPVVVGGDESQRHGIVLAKNEEAKRFGIKTAETLYQARQKAPHLVVLAPHHELYHEYSLRAKAIYLEYSSRVQAFGPDEAWIDVTERREAALAVAEEIRGRVFRELGLTVSIGVSWNKTFAKMGSDYKKPDAITVISRENFRALLWPKPVRELLFVGQATAKRLEMIGIHTIGDLAQMNPERMAGLLGKNGYQLVMNARGEDRSPVLTEEEQGPAKSIGAMQTTTRDIRADEDVKALLRALCQEVAERLAEAGMRCRTVRVTVKDKDFVQKTRQRSLAIALTAEEDLYRTSWSIYQENFQGLEIRLLGVTADQLEERDLAEQMSLFDLLAAPEVAPSAEGPSPAEVPTAKAKVEVALAEGAHEEAAPPSETPPPPPLPPPPASSPPPPEHEEKVEELVKALQGRFGRGIIKKGFSEE